MLSHKEPPVSPSDLVQDPYFYVNLENGKPVLKKSHSTGYYSQIYTFKGLIIVGTEFDVSYFDSLIQKLNSFDKKMYVT